ncbi:MAG TPA: EthD family reductase [Steroidobacteraceae bacterium]|nr:EthD family reductase [Steroidobacteraceae bacterium]
MITVNVLYRNSDAIKFNMNYYLDQHIPLVRKLLGAALKDVLVQQGTGGAAPGSKPEYAVITVLSFESMEAFQKVFPPHAPAITSDIVNFTNVEPTIQYSDVRRG